MWCDVLWMVINLDGSTGFLDSIHPSIFVPTSSYRHLSVKRRRKIDSILPFRSCIREFLSVSSLWRTQNSFSFCWNSERTMSRRLSICKLSSRMRVKANMKSLHWLIMSVILMIMRKKGFFLLSDYKYIWLIMDIYLVQSRKVYLSNYSSQFIVSNWAVDQNKMTRIQQG